MKVLVFDTETTGLQVGKNPSYRETDKWPHIVQMSFILYDTLINKILESHDYIISIPESVTISAESQAIHGISSAVCRRKGVPIKDVLYRFKQCQNIADLLVAHNLSFDKRVILASCVRENMYYPLFNLQTKEYCTMKRTVDIPIIVKRNSRGVYNKYPTLTQLHQYLFNGNSPKNLHDSYADILICLRCYIKLEHKYDILSIKGAIPSIYIEYVF